MGVYTNTTKCSQKREIERANATPEKMSPSHSLTLVVGQKKNLPVKDPGHIPDNG